MEKEKLIKEMLDAKAEDNNTIDLNAYGAGLADMFDKLTDKKRLEYAAIHLGVPESGDPTLDAMIVRSNRMKIATAAMRAVLTYDGGNCAEIEREYLYKRIVDKSYVFADKLLKQEGE